MFLFAHLFIYYFLSVYSIYSFVADGFDCTSVRKAFSIRDGISTEYQSELDIKGTQHEIVYWIHLA